VSERKQRRKRNNLVGRGKDNMSYFVKKEFKCPDCGKVIVSAWLIHLLNKVREGLGKPMIVNSGYRCKKYNKKIGGGKNSAHLRGTAADIKCKSSKNKFLMIELAYKAGFKRIGVYDTWLHLDVDAELPLEVLWVKKG
jgi:uncharacterized protein YcbK (DUF882 family)